MSFHDEDDGGDGGAPPPRTARAKRRREPEEVPAPDRENDPSLDRPSSVDGVLFSMAVW